MLINLTQHEIILKMRVGNFVGTLSLKNEGSVTVLKNETEKDISLSVDEEQIFTIPTINLPEYGTIFGLPPEKKDIYYLVPLDVFNALVQQKSSRKDIFCPATRSCDKAKRTKTAWEVERLLRLN